MANEHEKLPHKIADRRRVHEERRSGREQDSDAAEAFRLASFSSRSDQAGIKNRSPIMTKKETSPNTRAEPVVARSAGRSGPSLLKILVAATVLAGVTFAVGKYQRSGSGIPSNRTAAHRVQAIPQVDLQISSAAFASYQRQLEERHAQFTRSRRVVTRPISVPDGLSLSDAGLGSGAFALDINGDGVDEVYLQNGCGSGGCFGHVYQSSPSGYVQILDTPIDTVSDEVVNGYPIVFDARKHYLQGGGFVDAVVKFEWDGDRYREIDKFIMPEWCVQIADSMRTQFSSESPQRMSAFLKELSASVGTETALRAVLQFQAPPGFTLPTGSEYVEYVRQYAIEVEKRNPGTGERAFTRHANDPAGFFAAVYGRSIEPAFLNALSPTSIVSASLGLALRRQSATGDWQRHMEFWNRAQRNSGFIAAYRNATGHYPSTEQELWSAQNNVVTEDKLPVRRTSDSSTYRTTTSGSGTVESRSFNPVQVPGDPRYTSQPPPTIQERAGQIDHRTQQQLIQGAERSRQMINQGLQQGGKAVGDVLKELQQRGRGRQ